MSKKQENQALVPEIVNNGQLAPPQSEETKRKHNAFLDELEHGKGIKEAALCAGYSESYATSGIYRALQPGRQLRKALDDRVGNFPETARKISQLLAFHKIPQLDSMALKQYEENPELLLSKPAFLKAFKKQIGLIQEDSAPSAPVVNIEELKLLVVKGIPD